MARSKQKAKKTVEKAKSTVTKRKKIVKKPVDDEGDLVVLKTIQIVKRMSSPHISVWRKFPPTKEDIHFNRFDNNAKRLTPGKGFQFLLMDTNLYQNFAKKVSFVNHFRTYHDLNPEEIKRGQPGKPGKRPRLLDNDQFQAQEDRQRGNFLLKVWRAKQQKLMGFVNWAVHNRLACPPTTDVSDWIWEKATSRYVSWWKSKDFVNTLATMAKRTKEYWEEHPNQFMPTQLLKKVRVHVFSFLFFFFVRFQLLASLENRLPHFHPASNLPRSVI